MNEHISNAVSELQQLADSVRSSGEVADEKDRIEISTRGGDQTKRYARLRNGKNRTALGRENSDRHRAVLESLKRRDAINAINEAIAKVKSIPID